MPYAEFPGDEIIDCHFKKKDPPDPGDGDPDLSRHLCGEIGYDFPGDGWYSINYDEEPGAQRPAPAGGARLRNPPLRMQQQAIITPSTALITPRAGEDWVGFSYFLLGIGVYFNPYGEPSYDLIQGLPSLVVQPELYLIKWEVEVFANPIPENEPPVRPCNELHGTGYGFGICNTETDPEFNIYRGCDMPIVPNFGFAPGSVVYDVGKNKSAIFWTMGYANLVSHCAEWMANSECGPGGCFTNSWGTNQHFNIKAICPGAAAPGQMSGRDVLNG